MSVAAFPSANINGASFGVSVGALAIPQVVGPLALVGILVHVCIFSLTLFLVLEPLALINRTIRVVEGATTMFLVSFIKTNVSSSVLKN